MKTKHDILYVENDPVLSSIMKELSALDDYDSKAVADGVQAKMCLMQSDFDILVLDSKDKKVNSIDLLKWCRLNDKHMPIILLVNSKNLTEDEQIALKDCCTSTLVKPFDFDLFVEAMNEVKLKRHEFDCHGIIYDAKTNTIQEAFQGMHYFPENLNKNFKL